MAAAVSCGAIVAAATGCGGSTPKPSVTASTPGASGSSATPSPTASADPLAGLTADQIAGRALADLKAVSSVHVAGSVRDSGQAIGINLSMGARNCRGTLSIAGQGSFLLLKLGNTLWIKPDDQFWKHAAGTRLNPAELALVEGKYLQTTTKDSAFGSVSQLCDPRKFADAFGNQVHGAVKGKTTRIAGQLALQLRDTTDSDSAYVTISAHPEFLRLDGSGQGRLTFSDYNVPIPVTPPPASQTLNGATYGF
jgi:hypothetical protein